MWESDHKEGWAPKNGYFWTVVLQKTLESPLDRKAIKSANPKGDQPWIFNGRTDAEAEAEAPVLWPPDAKSWLIGKDPNAEKDWRQEEKGTTEDEMAGWRHQLNEHEFEHAPGVGDGHGSLTCWSPWVCKVLDRTEWWTKLILPQTPLPSRLPYNIDQSSLCYHIGPCWLSILNTAVCTFIWLLWE